MQLSVHWLNLLYGTLISMCVFSTPETWIPTEVRDVFETLECQVDFYPQVSRPLHFQPV